MLPSPTIFQKCFRKLIRPLPLKKMLKLLKNLKIRTKLFSLVIISLAGFVVFDYLGYRALDFLKVNGPLYRDIVRGKDTIADVLPPPKYIIESYLIAHHMLIEKHPEDIEQLFMDSARLEKEYIERQDFWSEELPDGELKEELTVLSHKPAMEFFKLRNEMFIPLIINGEIEKATNFLDESLEPLYQEHREHIERVVEIAKRMNEADERYARKIVFERSSLLVGWGLIVVASGALLSLYFVEQITFPLSKITRAAKKISEGDLSEQAIAMDRKDEIGILSLAVEEMRAALQGTLSGLREKIIEYEQAQEELLVSRNLLEARVKERTLSLEEAIKALNLEIAEHKRARLRLNVQYEIASLLPESASFSGIANKILGLVCDSLGWDFGEVWRVDREANILRCAETWHSRSNDFQELESVNRAMTFSPGSGLPGRVWADKKAIWISDVTKDSNFTRAPVAEKEGLHGGFGFPILFGTEVMAVMEFFSSEIRQPDPDTLQMFSALGSQLGQFIERKQTEEKISRLNQELEGRVVERTALLESALKQLEEANTMNQLLLQSIPFAMDIVDEEGNIIALNPMLEALFGRQAIGRKCWQLYRDNQRQCPNCPLLKTAEIGDTETLEVNDCMGGKIYSISHTVMMYKGKRAILEIFQ
ncbi:HAMP domain-containing protein, partial [bacterium]